MKKALITISAALLLAGCRPTPQERVHIFHVEYKGHTYVVAEAYGGLVASSYQMSFMHDPDCLCHHND